MPENKKNQKNIMCLYPKTIENPKSVNKKLQGSTSKKEAEPTAKTDTTEVAKTISTNECHHTHI